MKNEGVQVLLTRRFRN